MLLSIMDKKEVNVVNNDLAKVDSLEELFAVWKKKEATDGIDHKSNRFIADGVVNRNAWACAEKKILFVLKEAYDLNGDFPDLVDWIGKDHPNKRMWRRVARWIYGINLTTSSTIADYKPQLSNTEHIDSLNQIAVLNLKKSNGKTSSTREDIVKYAEYDREEIKREIELIDPDIVICGSTFSILYENVYEQKPLLSDERNNNWFYYKKLGDRERLYIDYYHPANQWPDLMNYYSLMCIYQKALLYKEKL